MEQVLAASLKPQRNLRGAAMSLRAAVNGFVLLLSLSVVQAQDGWTVTYTPTNICALRGSTVMMSCTYTHPEEPEVTVEHTLWFVKESNDVYVDLRTDPDYSARVDHHCKNKRCSVTIRDLRLSDSAEYKVRFITNSAGGTYVGQPGVTLSVTDLQVQVKSVYSDSALLNCHSSCPLPDHHNYTWYKNGRRQSRNYQTKFIQTSQKGSYSCAVTGRENIRSPAVVVDDLWNVTYSSTQICAFKGSTVNISCTYRMPSRINRINTEVKERFWFTENKGDNNVKIQTDSDYTRRVHHHCERNHCTLTISDLRESDSALYKFRFITNHDTGKYTGRPGVSLSVTDPQLQVDVRRSTVSQWNNWTELTCINRCQLPDPPSYIWYRNKHMVKEGKEYFHLDTVDPADAYSCSLKGFEEFPSAPVYPPNPPSVSVSSSAEVVEGSSVTLTCSSDSNPAPQYTWYKKNQRMINTDPQLVFRSIKGSDSGHYYCTAANKLGSRMSDVISTDVKYGPRPPSVSVSPSAEIVEGSSVNLTCSSDSNPAPQYTWYKENQTLHQGADGLYHFSSITSEDSGIYYCTSENPYGLESSSVTIDVQYPPRPPSVSVSPSAEIVEGSSVTLTCSSDSNPAPQYTWYKENEESPKASGQTFTITDVTHEHSGNYYCEAQNMIGRRNSTLYLTVAAGSWTSAAAGGTTVLLLLLLLLLVVCVLWIRKRKKTKESSEPEEGADHRDQRPPDQGQEQDDPLYTSVQFSKEHTEPVYSNIRAARPLRHEEGETEYAAVRFTSKSSAQR